MTFDQAMKRAGKTGVKKAGAEEFLALICETLASLHAISPALVFEGAKKRKLSASQVAKMALDDPVGLGDLMFV